MRGKRCLLVLPLQSKFGRKRIERPLGRIAFDFPNPRLLAQLGIVAEHRNPAHQFQHRLFVAGCPFCKTCPSLA